MVMISKSQATKPKIDNWDFSRLESSPHKKQLIAWKYKGPMRKKIFANQI